MILIVASTKDVAGMNIANFVIEHYRLEKLLDSFHENPVYFKRAGGQEVKLVFVKEEIIQTQFITNFFKPDLIVFVSRHSSESRIPTLSVHVPGNLSNKAEFGGLPNKVSIAPASAMKNCLAELKRQKEERQLDYEISYECTHHGPSLDVPSMFAELGSSLSQWRDLKAAEAVACAAMSAIEKQTKHKAVLGIGGPHYNDKFTRFALTSNYAFGHIIPKYTVGQVDYGMLKQCVERSAEKTEAVILDWKGIKSADKEQLQAILSRTKIPIQRI
jgi:D-aminoacyl-tRNA deacylase